MKHGKTVDPETAQKLVKDITAHVLMASGKALNIRPVIWPEEIATHALAVATENRQLPQRELAHMVCLDDEIIILVHIPSFDDQTGQLFGVVILEFHANYYGKLLHELPARMFVGSRQVREVVERGYEIIQKNYGAPLARHEVLALEEILSEADATEEVTEGEEKAKGLLRASALEAFAFSPYAVTRPRPTTKQAINPNPKKKGWPAIEVVSLRLPEKRPPSAPTGRKIDLRFPVKEHLRRQPTKEGIRLITIHQHWRGPENAPVKPKTQKVYKVVK